MDTSYMRHPNNSASETTLSQLMDMFVVILGILGAGLVTWMYISQRSTFMILACLAIMAYAIFMLFIANNMLAQLNMSPDAFQYKMVRWTTYGVFMLDFMLLVAVITTDWWDGKKKSIETAKRSEAQQSRRPWDDQRRGDWNSGKKGKKFKKGKGGRGKS